MATDWQPDSTSLKDETNYLTLLIINSRARSLGQGLVLTNNNNYPALIATNHVKIIFAVS